MSDASSPQHGNAPNWRRDAVVARILRRWRELTGDRNTRDDQRRTLVACSAGADSVTLAFAISRVPGSCVIAHIRHDLREPNQTRAERDLVAHYARQWGVPFAHASVAVADLPGNTEANARHERYEALQRIALDHGCRFIATAHHADDQLETILMHLIRGSGIRSIAGMPDARSLPHATLVRPMLGIARQDIVALLRRASLRWREDETNRDTTLTRNRIRHQLIPVMRSIDPRIAEHAAQWAEDMAAARGLVEERLDALLQRADRSASRWAWDRDALRPVPPLVLGAMPHRFIVDIIQRRGLDRLTRRSIDAWVRSVKSHDTDPITHRIGPILSRVDARRVTLERAPTDEHDPPPPDGANT